VAAVGGGILHTEDGGATWKKQISGTDSSLDAVTFATTQPGAAGSAGTESIQSAALRSGWVAGYDGLILHTEDGGVTLEEANQRHQLTLERRDIATPHSSAANSR
jgi:photosystem II stability/assembly factor-like uncharacterized protein